MTVSPIAPMPELYQRFPNQSAPAGLQVLQKPVRILPPLGSDGNGLPPDKILPYSGIYDERGKLPSGPAKPGFLAYA